jgi:hypothetical protein
MELKSICKNPWCKATFVYRKEDMIPVDTNYKISKNETNEVEMIPPLHCYKCKSFDSELSGGIEWKDKEYEGSRFDGMPHQVRYKVTNFK